MWGLAWRPTGSGQGELFAASFVKRHSGLGPNRNPGTIYRIPVTGTSASVPSVLVSLPAGSDPHPADAAGEAAWLRDGASWDEVGKRGLGDIDLSADGQTIYAVNLADRRLYAIPRSTPTSYTSIAIPQPTGCAAADWRPFGLGIDSGRVHVGVVCTNQSTQATNASFAAHVFRTDAAVSAFETTPALSVALAGSAYPRKCNGTSNRSASDNTNPACNGEGIADWRPWAPIAAPSSFSSAYPRNSQPWLTDIVFDSGDLVLGFRDRFGDQIGNGAYAPAGIATTLYWGVGQGDQLRACANAQGGWSIESNGSCGGVAGSGVANGEGPGGGEFYNGDDNYFHDQIFVGGLAQIPGTAEVAGTAIDPFPGQASVFNGGVLWSSNATGARTRSHEVHTSTGPTFGKANGLGDLEALCAAAPIQVGDRVFDDRDADGVQDPAEPGLAGVQVVLRDAAGVQIGTTTTNGAGVYLFGGDANANLTAGQAIAPLSSYSLVVSAPGGTVIGPQNATADHIDSDASSSGVVAFTTGRAGANDHSLDIGIVRTFSLGNRVFSDRDGDGLQGASEPGIAGVALRLLSGEGVATQQTTTTDPSGRYRFDALLPGDYIVEAAASNFAAGGPLAGQTSTSGTGQEVDPDGDGDANDNGWDAPVAGAVRSLAVTLGIGPSEPVGEGDLAPSGQGAADAYANMTLDLGFVGVGEIGDRVWFDDDADGQQDEPAARGVNGVRVELLDAGGRFIAATTTVSDAIGPGAYRFSGLRPGTYAVRIDLQTLPAGYALTTPDVGAEAGDSDAAIDTGLIGPVVLPAGARLTGLDAGIWRPSGSYRILVQVREPLSGAWLDADDDVGTLGTNDPSPAVYLAGERARYLITVVNTGNTALDGIALTSSDCALTETIATLPAGASRAVECVRPGLQGDQTLTASASGARVAVGGVPAGPVLPTQSERAATTAFAAAYSLLKEVQHPVSGAWLDADAIDQSPGSNDGVPVELFAGETARYRITLTNTGQVDLRGIAVTDAWCGASRTVDVALGRQISLSCERAAVSADHINTASSSGGTPVLPTGRQSGADGGALPPLPTQFESAAVTVHTARYELLKEVLDPLTGTWHDADATAQSPGANDAILPLHSLGTTAVFRISVINTGTVMLTGLKVTDPLTGLSAEVTRLPAGERAVFECTLVVTGDLVNVATASGAVPMTPGGRTGAVLADHTESAGVRVRRASIAGLPTSSQLLVTKVGPRRAAPGALLVYKITVKVPARAGAARAVTVRDVLPAGLVLASPKALQASGGEVFQGRVVWRLGTMAPGATRSVSVLMRVGRGTRGLMRNRAQVSADNAPTATAFAVTTILSPGRPGTAKVTG